MFSFDSLGHINVVVPDLEEATRFYQALFHASVDRRRFRTCEIARRRAPDQRIARVPAVSYQSDQAARIELSAADGDTAGAKEAICEIVKEIRFFYAIDRYGIEWEFEEGHADIGTG